MISVILGHKGSGKTKRLISCVNEAVESYKRNMFALLGKPGYEKEKEALEQRLNK